MPMFKKISFLQIFDFILFSTPPLFFEKKVKLPVFWVFLIVFMNNTRNKKIRLVKEVVFHNGLLKHQLFSENPSKMEFFVF